jgi:hypothetical protein
MADFYPVIARAVSSLGNNTPEARQKIYARARATLPGLLGNKSELELARERLALETAIQEIEAQRARTDAVTRKAEISQSSVTPRPVPPALEHDQLPPPALEQGRPASRPWVGLYRCHLARKGKVDAKLHPWLRPASTGYLVVSILFLTKFWMLDPTSMSLFWVARAGEGNNHGIPRRTAFPLLLLCGLVLLTHGRS